MLLAGLFLVIGTALADDLFSGVVTASDTGEPIVGATVKVVGTTLGTVTDLEGKFNINAPEGSKLEFSYVGMTSKTLKAAKQMSIKLEPNSKVLEEVVVTGYGNFKKSSFTGAASTINTEALASVPVLSVENKLAGSVPGVTITSESGSPGAVSQVRIRGMGSINAGNEPLYVIDGTPVTSGNMSEFTYSNAGTNVLATINPNDIENVTIIKDAAAASLYGSRAANGVVVITTKSGSKGKTRVDFRSDWGASNMAVDYRPQLSGPERRAVLLEGLKNFFIYSGGQTEEQAAQSAANKIDSYAAEPATGWTDWKKLLFRTGTHQNYQANVSGGNERTQFYSSAAYTKQNGITQQQSLERLTGNLNVTHTWGRLKLNLSSMFSKMTQSVSGEAGGYDAPIANYVLLQTPSSVAYNADGSFAAGGGFVKINPLYQWQHKSDRNVVHRAFNTLRADFKIVDGLSFSQKVAYDFIAGKQSVLWDRYSNDGKSAGGNFQRVLNDVQQLNAQTQLNYVKVFGEHHLDALLGFETEDYSYTVNYLNGSNYPGDLYEISNAGTTKASTEFVENRLVSYLGRVNYNFANRYYLGLSFRRDGSSRLARSNRWGDFWSVSGSWRFTDEPFLANLRSVLSDGKLRVSYGLNGTQPSSSYGYLNLYKYGERYNGQPGMGITAAGNPDLKWEKNKAFNAGVDLGFFNRINLSFDYYTRTTSDLIYDMPISFIPGYFTSEGATQPRNIGSLRNSGFELTLSSVNIAKKDFTWNTSVNLGHNRNKVLSLNGVITEAMDTNYPRLIIHRVGETYNAFYGYEYAGVDAQTGKELYYVNDTDNPSRETTTEVGKANKVILGSSEAAIQGGITNNLSWKFIDLGLTFTYQLGGDAYDYLRFQHSNGGAEMYRATMPTYNKLEDMWKGPGDTSAKLPKFQYGSSFVYSSRWMMPLDYLRLKNLTVGFSAPQNILSRLGLSKARVYFSANNLLTFKSSKLYVDPEVPVSGAANFETPQLRTYTFGVEVAF